ncbi:MAG TPA: hypothetical protein VM124_03970 [Candidatus Limnocylindrales bacterium]|nr:hypothetical protein [Candidatus Limnocylindrales bacterium]
MSYEIGPGIPNQKLVDFWEAADVTIPSEAAFPDADVARWEASEAAAHYFLVGQPDEAYRAIEAGRALPGDN